MSTGSAVAVPPSEAAVALVEGLAQLGSRARSALRHAAVRPLGADVPVYDLFRELWQKVRRKYPAPKWAAYFVVALYPWHPRTDGRGSLAEALRRLRPPASQPEARQRADRRFLALLEARQERILLTLLAAAVRRLADKDVPLDWARLFDDLRRWYRPGNPVQHGWADAYFTR